MHTSPKIAEIESKHLRTDLPDFRVGDTVRVHYRIVEGDKERTQVFQGVVIKRHRAGARSSFTVRKVSYGVGVERIFLSQLAAHREGRRREQGCRPPRPPLLLARPCRQGRSRPRPERRLILVEGAGARLELPIRESGLTGVSSRPYV